MARRPRTSAAGASNTTRATVTTLATVATLLLAACGGGGDGGPPAADCSVAGQQRWLRDTVNDRYFWYALSPNPSPAGYSTVASYFEALLYTGTSTTFPADRWSGYESTESFERFFGQGRTLGYGVSVAGTETAGDPARPLYVRYVEALSPAARAGVQRGDQVISVNGVPASTLIAADDFSAFTPARSGDTLTLVLRRGSVDASVVVTAEIYALSPVAQYKVVQSPQGRAIGYVFVKDMLSQAQSPLQAAFEQFKSARVQDLVIDLRYNGGGLVGTSNDLGSYATGARTDGQVFSRLLFNDKHASSNRTYRYAHLAASLGMGRVYLLTGPRTCSASEQLINALRPVAEVVTIGDTTCGKPVGSVPESRCGTTYSLVNFEIANANNEGRYFDGFEATCPVPENFAQPLGAPGEALLAQARQHADSNVCTAESLRAKERARALGARPPRPTVHEPGERHGMVP